MERKGLIPNKSYEIFMFGDEISNYLHMPHRAELIDRTDVAEDRFDTCCFDTYYFDDFEFEVWVENGKIETVRCQKECYWNGINLIKMTYDDFLVQTKQIPSDEDVLYVAISPDRGQNQRVYSFDDLGMMIWVWRGKIRTVLLYNLEDE